MYLPSTFRVDDPRLHREIVDAFPFATLVSSVDGEPFATHVPLIADDESPGQLTLLGHVARANPQWRAFDGGAPVLAIFHGPHAYVSPRGYEQPRLHVPTWNYVALHAHGRARLLDEAATRRLVDRASTRFEAPGEDPWRMAALDEERASGLLAAIIGFAIAVERVDCKLKLSQNRGPTDRQGVLEALEKSPLDGDRQLARWMRSLEGGDAARPGTDNNRQ